MTSETKKTIFPAFGWAGYGTSYVPNIVAHESSSCFLPAPDTKTLDFYRAISSLLLSFFKNGLAPNVHDSNIGFQAHLSTSNEFSMYFYLPPESSLEAEQFLKIMHPFILELLKANSDGDLSSIQLISDGTQDSPVYILRSSDIRDMLIFSERVLAPYDMTLNNSFNAGQATSLTDSFRFDAIYSLPRVRALASMALGNSLTIDGLHLNH